MLKGIRIKEIGPQINALRCCYRKFNPDETNKKVSLGTRGRKRKGKVARPMVDLAESRDGSIHHSTIQYLGLISQILKRFSGLQIHRRYR
jgi:hypothetical protein